MKQYLMAIFLLLVTGCTHSPPIHLGDGVYRNQSEKIDFVDKEGTAYEYLAVAVDGWELVLQTRVSGKLIPFGKQIVTTRYLYDIVSDGEIRINASSFYDPFLFQTGLSFRYTWHWDGTNIVRHLREFDDGDLKNTRDVVYTYTPSHALSCGDARIYSPCSFKRINNVGIYRKTSPGTDLIGADGKSIECLTITKQTVKGTWNSPYDDDVLVFQLKVGGKEVTLRAGYQHLGNGRITFGVSNLEPLFEQINGRYFWYYYGADIFRTTRGVSESGAETVVYKWEPR